MSSYTEIGCFVYSRVGKCNTPDCHINGVCDPFTAESVCQLENQITIVSGKHSHVPSWC